MGLNNYSGDLTSIKGLYKFDTCNVINMWGMFYNCSNLTTLDISNFNTNKVTDMSFIFNGCKKLQTLTMKNATFTGVTKYTSMFGSATALTNISVKDTDAKTFIEARLVDASKTGVIVTIAS